jgi:GT2 family glycosyltransferase
VILGLGGYAAHSHRCFPRGSGGYFNRLKVRQNVSAVTGACLVVRKAVYEQVDGMDERLTVAYNDVDFCLKVLDAGYLNVFTPFAELYHFESKTRGYDDTAEKQVRFQREKDYLRQKWGDRISLDPYYNPNLTHAREDFSIGL